MYLFHAQHITTHFLSCTTYKVILILFTTRHEKESIKNAKLLTIQCYEQNDTYATKNNINTTMHYNYLQIDKFNYITYKWIVTIFVSAQLASNSQLFEKLDHFSVKESSISGSWYICRNRNIFF